jgi:hypothetical protein
VFPVIDDRIEDPFRTMEALRPLRLYLVSFFASFFSNHLLLLFSALARLVLVVLQTQRPSPFPDLTRSPTRCLTREAEARSSPSKPHLSIGTDAATAGLAVDSQTRGRPTTTQLE